MEAANLGAYAAGFADPEGAIGSALEELKTRAALHASRLARVRLQGAAGDGAPPISRRAAASACPPGSTATSPRTSSPRTSRSTSRTASARKVCWRWPRAASSMPKATRVPSGDFPGRQPELLPHLRSDQEPHDPVQHRVLEPDGDELRRPRRQAQAGLPLLHKLATEKNFDDYLLLTDDPEAVVQFIKDHPPVA